MLPNQSTWVIFRRDAVLFSEAGQSLIEMALLLPVLFLVLTGIFSFGISFNNYILLTEATGTAARQLSISRGATTDPCATTASALYAAAPVLNKSNISLSFNLNGTAYNSTSSCSSSSTSTGAAGNLVQGQPAVLTVTYPCSLKVYKVNLVPNCQLQSQTTEIVQ